MKKIKFFVTAALAMGLMSACNHEENLNGADKKNEGSTYMSVTLTMARDMVQGSTRAGDNQKADNPDYNNVGKWAGKDKIEAIEVYVFDDGGLLEGGINTFTADAFEVTQAADNKTNITPKKGIKVTPGAKTIYVVVNPTTESSAYLADKTGSLAVFKAAYENVMNNIPAQLNNTTLTKTVADRIARVDGDKDVILMTIAKTPGTVTVEKNVKEAETIAATNPKNRAKVEVKRAVGRVMITTRANTYNIVGDDATTINVKETNFTIGTITDIKYVVAQGEKSLYFQQKLTNDENLSVETPNSAYIPANGDFATAADDKYDYSGLWRNYNADPVQISGTPVPVKTLYNELAGTSLTNITADLVAQLNGEFILPNTHKWGATDAETGYRRGNTAYVLVRARFTPAKVIMNDGSENLNYPANTDYVLGKNGVFYESKTAAQDATKKGVANQTCRTYSKGKMIYYAWVNPDNGGRPGWLNSPVLRNNIYHIEITGFKTLGWNWNPLVPTDPKTPNPDSNPDPEPPTDPQKPDPEDPLTPSETWMSVETVILPWDVHSYGVEL